MKVSSVTGQASGMELSQSAESRNFVVLKFWSSTDRQTNVHTNAQRSKVESRWSHGQDPRQKAPVLYSLMPAACMA